MQLLNRIGWFLDITYIALKEGTIAGVGPRILKRGLPNENNEKGRVHKMQVSNWE